MGVDLEALTGNANTVARSCLTGYRDVRSTDNDRCLQPDYTADIEHDDTGTTLFASPAERPRTIVIEVCNDKNLAATTAERVHTAAFSTRESRNLCLLEVVRTESPWHIRTSVHSFGLNYRECYSPGTIAMGSPRSLKRVKSCLSLLCNLRILCAGSQRDSQRTCCQKKS